MSNNPAVNKLIQLHRDFWERNLDKPIVNIDCSTINRIRHIPALPAQWEGMNGKFLEPQMLSPEGYQPHPAVINEEHPAYGEVAFNAVFPYFRVPWLLGIVGCRMEISTYGKTVWPVTTIPDNWYEIENQGFTPDFRWLDKLLEFVRFIVDQYYPERCVPAPDVIARGIGDLCLHLLEPDRFYTSFYDHTKELKLLLDRIADVYIRWAKSQLEIIPEINGGYCNQYGIWSPGTCVRFQEDYCGNLSRAMFEEFILPGIKKVIDAIDYQVLHTHSGIPQLAEWVLEEEGLKCIEVSVDPTGPTIEESLPLWNRVLETKCLIITGPITHSQLDLLVSKLNPGGLLLDIDLVPEEAIDASFDWDKTMIKSNA